MELLHKVIRSFIVNVDAVVIFSNYIESHKQKLKLFSRNKNKQMSNIGVFQALETLEMAHTEVGLLTVISPLSK